MITLKRYLQNYKNLLWFDLFVHKWFLILVVHRKKLMTKFQCLPFFTSLLYLPSRYLQQSRFDPCALNSYTDLFHNDTNFLLFYYQWKVTLFSIFMQVDVSIMEVGLGGKYDATNVVCIIVILAEMCLSLTDYDYNNIAWILIFVMKLNWNMLMQMFLNFRCRHLLCVV